MLYCFSGICRIDMLGDRRQPGKNLAVALKAVESAERLVKSLLRQFLGKLLIAAKPENEMIDPLVVLLVYVFKLLHDPPPAILRQPEREPHLYLYHISPDLPNLVTKIS
jgi:hypothetical protein